MAGDRRATAGNIIAHRRVRKVYPADDYSAVAISGTAGMAVELIKLFQTELEHYEKIEGTRLSKDVWNKLKEGTWVPLARPLPAEPPSRTGRDRTPARP